MSNPHYYNPEQRNLFMKTFGVELERFKDVWPMMASGKWSFDIVKFDDFLQKKDPDYNSDECTYKDQTNISTFNYIRLVYGEHIGQLINDLLDSNFLRTTYEPIPFEIDDKENSIGQSPN